jgi:hypothetical protein
MLSANGVARLLCPGQVTKMVTSNRNYVLNYLLNFLVFCSVIEKFVESQSILSFNVRILPRSSPPFRICCSGQPHYSQPLKSHPLLPTPLLTAVLMENRIFGYVTSLTVTLHLSLCMLLSIFVHIL